MAAVLLALGLPASAAHALDARRPLGDFGVQAWVDELPQATVAAVLQTRDGYIWAGTFEGLVRFDGVAFTTFDLPTASGSSARGAMALYEDREGALWIGTNGGGLVRYQGGTFTHFATAGIGDGFTFAFQEDRDGTLWVGTSRGLARRDGAGFTLVDPLDAAHGGPAIRVRALAADREGVLWVATQAGLLKGRDGRFERVPGLPSDDVRAVAFDGAGVVYVGTEGDGLSLVSGDRVRTLTTRDGLAGDAVRTLLVDREGAVWAGTEGGGISRLWRGELTSLDAAHGLPGDLIRSIAQDHEGSIWIGTNGGGLGVLRDQKFTTYGPEHGLAQPNVRVVLEDRAGTIWAGTDGGGLVALRPARGAQNPSSPGAGVRVYTTRDGLPDDYVRALLEGRDGTLWVGTKAGGVSRLRDGRVVPLDLHGRLGATAVAALEEARDGAIWIGTSEVGLFRMRLAASGAAEVERVVLPPRAGDVKALLESSDGTLWVGTTSGVCKVTGNRVELLDGDTAVAGGHSAGGTLAGDNPAETSLAGIQAFSFLEDPDGSLWIGTDRGLLRLHGGRAALVGRRMGLPDDVVFRILDDGAGNLWLTSNHGVSRVSRASLLRVEQGNAETLDTTSYARGDGLRSHQCNGASQPAGWRARDGRLLIPTNRGLSIIDPARLTVNVKPPPVAIERLVVDGQDQPSARVAGGDLALPAGVERFELHYTALSFLAPERVRFRYKLEGYDRDWVDAGSRRVAYYTRTGPGEFRFRVQASNNDGVWNETGARLAFSIAPQLWETRWFVGLVALALAALGFGLSRARVRRLTRRARELEAVVDERTRQLQTANQRLEDLSFLDPLTGIANRRRFDEVLVTEWRRAARSGTPLSVLVMDVDFFKQYNDALGHPAGDACLAQLAKVLAEHVNRPGDLAARLGGEEFAFIAATDGNGAESLADRLRRHVVQLGLPHPSSSVERVVTISVGVATTAPGFGGIPTTLVEAADRALYAAKKGGRNRVERFDPPTAPGVEAGAGEERIM